MTGRPLEGRVIALCVAGGIAAYKAPIVARQLLALGARVLPVMTRSAQRFVGAVTLSGLCGEPVRDDMWDPSFAGELHVALASQADCVAVVPTTADLLARLAEGRADDLVTALCLVARGPIVIAPAMHPRMWAHPAVRRNVATIEGDARARIVGPVFGAVASGEEGVGRMSEPEDVVAAIVAALSPRRDLEGRHVVVSAGPTVEDLDPVRFLGNRSSGKMGFAVAAAASARGARVTLVTGPVVLSTPSGCTRVDVRGALDMQTALDEALDDAGDALVMAAAVADHRPAEYSSAKTKKVEGDTLTLTLVKNPDLLAAIGARRAGKRHPVLVGFAVETNDLEAYARKKRAQKQVDFVVANLAAHGFGGDDDHVLFVDDGPARAVQGSKRAIADAVLDEVVARLA